MEITPVPSLFLLCLPGNLFPLLPRPFCPEVSMWTVLEGASASFLAPQGGVQLMLELVSFLMWATGMGKGLTHQKEHWLGQQLFLA